MAAVRKKIEELWRNAGTLTKWAQFVYSADAKHPGGFFVGELIEHWEEIDGIIDDAKYDPADRTLKRTVNTTIETTLFYMQSFRFLTCTDAIPDRRYPNVAFDLIPEPLCSLTKRGVRLKRLSMGAQHRTFARLILLRRIKPSWTKLRAAIGVAGTVFTVLKLGLQWHDQHAAVTALLVGVALPIVSLISREH